MRELVTFVVSLAISALIAPTLSKKTHTPVITVYLLLGLLVQSLTGVRTPKVFEAAHDAALACITFAAGSELVVAQLQRNARRIGFLSTSLTLSTLVIVFFGYLAAATLLPAPAALKSTGGGEVLGSPLSSPPSSLPQYALKHALQAPAGAVAGSAAAAAASSPSTAAVRDDRTASTGKAGGGTKASGPNKAGGGASSSYVSQGSGASTGGSRTPQKPQAKDANLHAKPQTGGPRQQGPSAATLGRGSRSGASAGSEETGDPAVAEARAAREGSTNRANSGTAESSRGVDGRSRGGGAGATTPSVPSGVPSLTSPGADRGDKGSRRPGLRRLGGSVAISGGGGGGGGGGGEGGGEGGGSGGVWKLRLVQAMFAAVVAVGRSPSSAIAVVGEARASGPFTTTVLSVTMVTDVLVILLFTAAEELAHILYAPSDPGGSAGGLFWRFILTFLLQISLSLMHATCLTLLAMLILRLSPKRPPSDAGRPQSAVSPPPSPASSVGSLEAHPLQQLHPSSGSEDALPEAPGKGGPAQATASGPPLQRGGDAACRSALVAAAQGRGRGGGGGEGGSADAPSPWSMASVVQPALLLILGGYAFRAEPGLQRLAALADDYLTGGTWLDEKCLRLEPMLACMIAGFALCNLLGKRHEMTSLLHVCLPPLLAIFFFSTGASMRVSALRRTWPTALALFGARILALWFGTFTGSVLTEAASCSPKGFRSGFGAGFGAGFGSGFGSGAELEGQGKRRELQCCGWAAFVTQAGITLGLSDEIAAAFPSWGPALQAPLVSSIVLSQLVGPPLLMYALKASGEARAGVSDEENALLPGGRRSEAKRSLASGARVRPAAASAAGTSEGGHPAPP